MRHLQNQVTKRSEELNAFKLSKDAVECLKNETAKMKEEAEEQIQKMRGTSSNYSTGRLGGTTQCCFRLFRTILLKLNAFSLKLPQFKLKLQKPAPRFSARETQKNNFTHPVCFFKDPLPNGLCCAELGSQRATGGQTMATMSLQFNKPLCFCDPG